VAVEAHAAAGAKRNDEIMREAGIGSSSTNAVPAVLADSLE
jgi:hypothetical protein